MSHLISRSCVGIVWCSVGPFAALIHSAVACARVFVQWIGEEKNECTKADEKNENNNNECEEATRIQCILCVFVCVLRYAWVAYVYMVRAYLPWIVWLDIFCVFEDDEEMSESNGIYARKHFRLTLFNSNKFAAMPRRRCIDIQTISLFGRTHRTTEIVPNSIRSNSATRNQLQFDSFKVVKRTNRTSH